MMAAMKRLTPLLLVALSVGCAHQPTVSEHLRASEISLKGAHVRHDQDVKSWASKVDARIAHCRSKNLKTEAERAGCMGVFGAGANYEQDLRTLAESYDVIADELVRARDAAKRLEELYDAAQNESEANGGN